MNLNVVSCQQTRRTIFNGLFSSSTLDLSDTALGSDLNTRSKNIQALIRLFEDLDMVALQKSDILGDACEYLIGQFAMESGKRLVNSIPLTRLVKSWLR